MTVRPSVTTGAEAAGTSSFVILAAYLLLFSGEVDLRLSNSSSILAIRFSN